MSVLSGIGKTIVSDFLTGVHLLGDLLTSLKNNGVVIPVLGTFIEQQIENVEAAQADYDSGQAVVVGSFAVSDPAGASDAVLIAVKKDGAVYETLFGSNT